jgi:hypothetical protein
VKGPNVVNCPNVVNTMYNMFLENIAYIQFIYKV